mgnify:CR=1 FL=1
MPTENWYLKNKSRIMREMRLSLRSYRTEFEKAYGKAAGEAIARESLERFEASLPDLPYIGGDENRLSRALCITAFGLAMYRSLQAHGASVEEAARLIYLGTERFYTSFPTRWLMRWQGRQYYSRKHQDRVKRAAAASQERRYPENWVFEAIEGDGQDFDFGVDYTECGLIKYLEREGAPELAPYLCWTDYPMFAAMGMKLTRTETLARGGQRSDFRLSRGKPERVEPEFLHV